MKWKMTSLWRLELEFGGMSVGGIEWAYNVPMHLLNSVTIFFHNLDNSGVDVFCTSALQCSNM